MQASEGKPRTELGGCATGTWHSSIYNLYIMELQYNLFKTHTHRHMIMICVHRSLHPILTHLPYSQGVRRSQHTMDGGWRMEGVRSRANSGWVALVVSLFGGDFSVCLFVLCLAGDWCFDYCHCQRLDGHWSEQHFLRFSLSPVLCLLCLLCLFCLLCLLFAVFSATTFLCFLD